MLKVSKENLNIIKNVIAAFAVKGGSLIVSMILLPLYIRFFQKQEILGIWYTILSVLNWIVVFDLGLGQGLRNQLPKALLAHNIKYAKELISTTYILMSSLAFIIAIIGITIIRHISLYSLFNVNASIIDYAVLEKCVIIIFLGIVVQIVLKIITSILYAMQMAALVNMLALCTNIIILLSLFVMPSRDIATNLTVMSWINVIAANGPYLICSIIIFKTKILKESKPSIHAFSAKYISCIFNIGLSLLWLQIVFMIVSSTNEFLITNFTDPKYVVEYQAYYKVFKTASMVVSLALTPIWSAVTKAQIERNYSWIKKVYYIFLVLTGVCFIAEICLIPFLQWGMNIWLGTGTIEVKTPYAIIFVLSSVIFVLHNVNTSIGNGLSLFKIQMIWMTIAAIIFIPLAWLLVKIWGSWIGVVGAGVLAMLPYEILAPFYTFKKINNM